MAIEFHDRHYVGASTYYTHASIPALLRHVRADNTLAIGKCLGPQVTRAAR